MNAANTNIDALLEQVAEALADGKNELAAHLLPEILQAGDEVQRLMAESYLMQIDAIQALEQDDLKPEDTLLLIDEAPLNKEEIITSRPSSIETIEASGDVNTIFEITDSQTETANTIDHLVLQNFNKKTDSDISNLDIIKLKQPEDTLLLIDEAPLNKEETITSRPSSIKTIEASGDVNTIFEITDSQTETTNTIDSLVLQNINKQTDSDISNLDIIKLKQDDCESSILENEIDSDGIQAIQDQDVVTDDNAIVKEINVIDSANDLETSDVSNIAADNEEVNTALMQAEMLIVDKEYETAELVLQTAFESGDAKSRSKAKAMMLQITNAKIPTDSNTTIDSFLEKQEDITTQTSVIDAIFEEGYEGFANQAENISAQKKEEILLSDILDIEAQVTDHESSNEEEPVNTDKIVENSYENLVEHKIIRESEESVSNERKLTELANELGTKDIAEEIEKTIVTEVFSDNEEISHLLSPTLALQGAENLLDINTTQGETASTDSVQRQGFYVGDLGLMIDFANGSELTEMPDFFQVPNAPKWFIGLTNMHGGVIPIFDLQTYFNITNDSSNTQNKKMLLVLKYDKNEKVFGIIVDGLPTRLSWSSTQKVNTNTSPASIRSHVNTACVIDGRLWFDLDTETLANTLENAI